MKITRSNILAALIAMQPINAVQAQSSVWEIEKDGRQLFIGGTIHVLSADDYPLPRQFDLAYDNSDSVVLETDIGRLRSPEFQQLALGEMIYTDGTNLRSLLKDETYQDLEAFCATRGIPAATLMMFKPGMVAMTLTLLELRRLGLMGAGVDSHFSGRADRDGKEVGQLETVEQQLSFLAAMGAGREDELIRYTLRDIGTLPELLESIKVAWRSGDLETLDEMTLMPLKQEFPELYRILLVNRNNAWVPMIESMFNSDEVELVLVGALHLVGEQGLLEQLIDRGYSVSRLQ